MMKLLSFALALLMGIEMAGAGCGSAEPSGCFSMIIVNRCDAEIYGIANSIAHEGKDLSGGGMCLADGSPVPAGDTCSIDFTPESLGLSDEEADLSKLSGMTVSVSVTDGNDREYPCAASVTLSPEQGAEYYFTLSGDYERGFTLLPGAENERVRKQILDDMGVDMGDLPLVRFSDDHGGFHGDGMTIALYSCSEADLDFRSGAWRRLPLPDSLASAEEAEPIADAQTGCWRFLDRHDEATDPGDPNPVDGRSSCNYSLLVYDEARGLLCYYKLDT